MACLSYVFDDNNKRCILLFCWVLKARCNNLDQIANQLNLDQDLNQATFLSDAWFCGWWKITDTIKKVACDVYKWLKISET